MPAQLFDSRELPYRAGGIRQRVVKKLEKSFEHSDPFYQRVIWEKSLEDVAEGYAVGPFYEEGEVECILGTPSWIAMPRFPVLQADKVRPVDDGSGSCANSFSYITEKLQVPTADLVVSTIRTLASSYSGKLGAWIVDEKSAFRQLPVAPESRAVAVVALCAPDTGRIAYFVMYGHPFGLSPSVYNYNRRARALTMMLVQDLRIIARNYFDDRFGVSRRELVEEEVSHVCHICHLLGIGISPKTQHGPKVDILGIVFDFDRGCLGIKRDRRTRLIDELHEILSTSQLSPGRAGKLKGKLLFVAGHYSGRHGRAFLGAIGERQYSQASKTDITPNIRKAVRAWIRILESDVGVRRLFDECTDKEADFVLFTDGAFPDIRTWLPLDETIPRIGWVSFHKDSHQQEEVLYSAMNVDEDVIEKWLPRLTQIGMIELLASVVAVEHMAKAMAGKTALLFVDSEAVEGCFVKGSSSREDQEDLVSIFWDLILEADIGMYISRVPTDSNPSDRPSRGDCSELSRRGASWVQPKVPEYILDPEVWRRRLQDRD